MAGNNTTLAALSPAFPLPFVRHLHRIAMCTSSCSIVASVCVIILSFTVKGQRGHLRKKAMMDRLVIYLTVGDIFFTMSHGLDHVILYANNETQDFVVCQLCAFFFHWGQNAGCLVSAFVAVSAFVGVVLGRRVRWPTFDIALLSVGFGLPGLLSLLGVSFGWFGFMGVWCGIDQHHHNYMALTLLYEAAFPWIAVVVGTFCYAAIPIKLFVSSWRLKRSGLRSESGDSGLQRLSAQFTVFILILYVQWLPLFIFFILLFGAPQQLTEFSFEAVVAFANLGGVYNAFAYTFLRLRNRVSPQEASA